MSRRERCWRDGLAPVLRLRNKGKKPGDLWIELKQAVPACTACGLHKTRSRPCWASAIMRANGC